MLRKAWLFRLIPWFIYFEVMISNHGFVTDLLLLR